MEIILLPKTPRPRAFRALCPITILQVSSNTFSRVIEADVGMHGFRKAHQCSEVISIVQRRRVPDSVSATNLLEMRSSELVVSKEVCVPTSYPRMPAQGRDARCRPCFTAGSLETSCSN